MKNATIFLVSLGCLMGLFSCSNDVDLYCDYKDVPIIYGMIDAKADTNFVKITKAFCGSNEDFINANEVALIYDSSNYENKLEAYIVELQSTHGRPYVATGRKFELDTLTIHDKEEGVFYAPDQLLYYTTEHFKTNTDDDSFKYKLFVIKPDGDTVTAETTVVGGNMDIMALKVDFQAAPSDAQQRLVFRASKEGLLYDIKMQFNYWEEHPGQERVKKTVSWSYGARPLESYENVTQNTYRLSYSVNVLFNVLTNAIGNDTVWNTNHPNVTRYIGDFVVTMAVAGRELYENYEMTMVMENGFTSSNYTNINGGFGMFSSRTNIYKTVELSSGTKLDLMGKPWGFVEE